MRTYIIVHIYAILTFISVFIFLRVVLGSAPKKSGEENRKTDVEAIKSFTEPSHRE